MHHYLFHYALYAKDKAQRQEEDHCEIWRLKTTAVFVRTTEPQDIFVTISTYFFVEKEFFGRK